MIKWCGKVPSISSLMSALDHKSRVYSQFVIHIFFVRMIDAMKFHFMQMLSYVQHKVIDVKESILTST